MEYEIDYEKFNEREVGIYCEGFSGTFYPKEKAIVVESSEGSAVSLDALEYIIKTLKSYKG